MKSIIKNNLRISCVLLLISFYIFSCKNSVSQELQSGDLLFVTAKNSGLSGAINNVTQKSK